MVVARTTFAGDRLMESAKDKLWRFGAVDVKFHDSVDIELVVIKFRRNDCADCYGTLSIETPYDALQWAALAIDPIAHCLVSFSGGSVRGRR
jgi:hypothetical protein